MPISSFKLTRNVFGCNPNVAPQVENVQVIQSNTSVPPSKYYHVVAEGVRSVAEAELWVWEVFHVVSEKLLADFAC